MSRSDRLESRTLFQDISFLTPVQEEEESFESPRRRPATRSALLPPARPYSPLPPLIIEVEKRVNKHDHTEDFYVRLEKKMKKIYNRLFIEGRNVSSPMSSDDDLEYSIDDNRSEQRGNGNIDIDEDIGGNTEPIVVPDYGNIDIDEGVGGNTEPGEVPDRILKRRTTDKVSNESDEEEDKVKSKRFKSSSSADPKTSSKEEFEDQTSTDIASSEENIEETNHADSLEVEESIDESINVERDDTQSASASLDHIEVTFQADVHRAYSDEANEPNVSLPPANVGDEMDDEILSSFISSVISRPTFAGRGDSANEGVQGPESVEEEVEESLENHEGNNALPAPDEGDILTTPRIQHDAIQDITTPCVQPHDIRESESAGEHSSELLGNNRVPSNSLLAPALEREVELMRTPLLRPSVGSLPEQQEDSSHGEQLLDFDFLNRTEDNEDDVVIEERDATTQTSFDEAFPGWASIFVGQPRVFNLCRCRFHVCD